MLDISTATKQVLANPAALGKYVLILDETDGYAALGLAELLAQAGVTVEVVTPHLFVGEETLKTLGMAHLFPRLKAAGVKLTAQQFVEQVNGHDVELYDIWGGEQRTLTVDTLVLALMRSPNDALYQTIRSDFKEVHRVGDVVAPRKLEAIIYEGGAIGAEDLACQV